MAFVNRLTAILNGFGTGLQNDTLYRSQGISLSTTAIQTNTLSGFSPTLSKGYIRVKIYGAGGTAPTLLALNVNVSDGTTFVMVYGNSPVVATAIVMSTTVAAGSPYTNGGSNTNPGGEEYLIPFEVDINCTQLSILTTLGGTTPTAKMDVEINGTV